MTWLEGVTVRRSVNESLLFGMTQMSMAKTWLRTGGGQGSLNLSIVRVALREIYTKRGRLWAVPGH